MAAFTPQNPDFEAHVRESFARLTLMRTIGGGLLRVAPGEIEIDLPFREDLTQHHGFMAAAVLTAIADVACGYAAMSLMPAGASPLTVEYKVNFISPAQGERMSARGHVIRPGRTVTACAGNVFAVSEGQEKLVATMLATIIQVGGARRVSALQVEERTHRRLRGTRSWCVCGGGGLRRRLREVAGLH